MSFTTHLFVGIIIRIILINYGEVQDQVAIVPYTDIDYSVVTDGSYHVLQGRSPFRRHTFRYTPILAYLLTPNHFIHRCFGKVLFSFFDLIVGVLIKMIVCEEFHFSVSFVDGLLTAAEKLSKSFIRRRREIKNNVLPTKFEQIAEYSAYLWLYNPLAIVIATRGNGDSISCALVLVSLYYLLKRPNSSNQYFISGLFLGAAIHFRIYPIAFTFAYFLSLSDLEKPISNVTDLMKYMKNTNKKQVSLTIGTITAFVSLTGLMAVLYGFEYLYEALVYHLVRKDTRHNFSLFFYIQYLTMDYGISWAEKVLILLPQLLTVFMISVKFGTNRQTLPFCIFCISFITVTYNSVITSQYFIWFLSLLPICAKNLKNLGLKRMIVLPLVWFLAQLGWLLPAYLLEYKGWNTFDFIFLQSAVFFVSNIIVLYTLISTYDITYNFKAS